MANKTDVGGKYTQRKVTEEEDAAIKELASSKKIAYLTAKEKYFAGREADKPLKEIKQPTKEKGTPRKSLSIDETKLGITMVISKTEAKSMGISGSTPTSQAIHTIRERLGLTERLRD